MFQRARALFRLTAVSTDGGSFGGSALWSHDGVVHVPTPSSKDTRKDEMRSLGLRFDPQTTFSASEVLSVVQHLQRYTLLQYQVVDPSS